MEPDAQPPESRYVVGIDLGTTNSAVTSVDTQREPWQTETFPIPQLVAPHQVEPRDTLPSLYYQAASGEFSDRALALPWNAGESPAAAVGVLAREQGALAPGRLVASAKSWLCHTGVDREAKLLPWQGAADVEPRSPVEVSAAYLEHIRQAWDRAHPDAPLAEQEVVLTLPASFDEVARELTVRAAAKAGLPRVVLIEEPQAAFYAWLDHHASDWRERVTPGETILVCDVGGGTTDLTLIRVRDAGQGAVQFHRVAVGDHLILGGDNLDLALARHVEQKLRLDAPLEPRQWSVLVRSCRAAKETLLSHDAPEQVTMHLPGAGSRVIGGGLQVEVQRDEARQVLVEGFFPLVELTDRPQTRQSGFQEFGLPYARDPAVTKYLAQFLSQHRTAGLEPEAAEAFDLPAVRPDKLLLAGGAFESAWLRDRVVESLRRWFANEDWSPAVLDCPRLDMAVARGAAYFGMVRRGQGVRIAAGLARTYYVGVEGQPPQVVCLVPASAEPGHEIEPVEQSFGLLVSEPVEFPLFVSSTRLTDRPGDLAPVDLEQLRPLPPIRTVLQTRRRAEQDEAQVYLHARLTEIGTLDLWCSETTGSRSWRLQFDVRSTTQTDIAPHEAVGEADGVVDETILVACRELIESTFGEGATEKPAKLVRRLAKAIGTDRREWPPTLLRRLWEMLHKAEAGRRRSPAHEARWLNLAGFTLRPGYGMALDDWRVAETRRLVQGKLFHPAAMVGVESWILWRRLSGGLSRGSQLSLADPLLKAVRGLHRQMVLGKGQGADVSFRTHESIEAWRQLGSLELIDLRAKIELGGMILDLLPKRKMEPVAAALAWTLGRVATRVPLYGPLNAVVPSEVVAKWVPKLMELAGDEPAAALAIMQMARKTDDRYRDLPESLRRQTIDWLRDQSAPEHYLELVEQGGRLDEEEQGRIFGETLPKGLRIA